jgi:hypothetical protein
LRTVAKSQQTENHPVPLSDSQIANIIFNETRSLSGATIQRARTNIAHTIINADSAGGSRPRTAPAVASVPSTEAAVHARCVHAVQLARQEKLQGIDPTNGARNFNFRANASRADFYNLPLQTQVGPLNNSFPTRDLPASGIYANPYGR